MSRPYDVCIFGATGFTGELVVLELARQLAAAHAALPSPAPSFAIAGRSAARLDAVLARVRAETAFDLSRVGVLIADSADLASLRRAAASCRVMLSCAGPFSKLGAPLLEACVLERTDYADVTGEPLFMERAELELHARAEAAGVAIVSCCGFDSIPADVGVAFARETLRAGGATATSVESFFTVRGGPRGFAGHFATLESAVLGLASVRELRAVRAAAAAAAPGTEKVPRYGPPLARADGPHFSQLARAWCLPFMGADASVVRRTQRALVAAREPDALPLQVACFISFKSWFWLAATSVMGGIIQTLARWPWGRALVLAHPRLFTLGAFSHAGPTPEQRATTRFEMDFFVRGAFGDAAAVAARGSGPSDARAKVRVAGPEPGYVATPLFLLAACYELLERHSAGTVPARGGVLTPAFAFRGPRSRLRERLTLMGIRFEVLEPCARV